MPCANGTAQVVGLTHSPALEGNVPGSAEPPSWPHEKRLRSRRPLREQSGWLSKGQPLSAIDERTRHVPKKASGWPQVTALRATHDSSLRPRLAIRLIRYTERLAEAGIEPSVGSKGDSYDNALAETINGLYKAELIHRRAPWKTREAVELATLEFWSHERGMDGRCAATSERAR